MKKKLYWWNYWNGLSLFVLLIVCIPILTIVVKLFEPAGASWAHVSQNLLAGYLQSTLWLLLGVAFFTFVIGVGLAWLVSAYDFPGRKIFEWMLILPLAFPTYMMAYSYVGVLEYTGPISSFLRNYLRITFTGPIFDIMNMPGAVYVFTMSLFPYVYVLCRSSFQRQSRDMQEAAFLLGSSRIAAFFRIALPLARPAIVGGVALAGMEVLNDYGTVRYYGVDTLTFGIFRSWFSLGDLNTAVYLSAILTLVVLGILWFEYFQRGNRIWAKRGGQERPPMRDRLKGSAAWACTLICFAVLSLGFLLPLGQLLYWVSLTWHKVLNAEFLGLAFRSFALALSASLLTVFFAILLLYTIRLSVLRWMPYVGKVATLGYAIPGAVIAVGVMVPVMGLDKWLIGILPTYNSLAISGSLFMLVFAYVVRFMAVGFNPVESGFQKSGVHVNEVSRLLGASSLRTLLRVDLPLIKNSVYAAILLVFVDVLKELPLTLILRPFNFHTLATRAFDLATNEMIAESANASLIVVLTGIVPIVILNRMIRGKEVK